MIGFACPQGEIFYRFLPAEERFVEILQQYEKYGKNAVTLQRYIRMHGEIREWM